MAHSESGSSQPATGGSGNALKKAALVAAAMAAMSPSASWALFGDRLELWAAENVTHDTNVLRLSKEVNPLFANTQQKGDTVYSTHLGAAANLQWSQQRVNAEYTWYKSTYRYFKDFDFTGRTARANWDWVLNPGAKGTLGYVESQGLASFANIQNRDPDLVTTRTAYATANYLLTPRLRLNGGLQGVQTRHDSRLRKVNDIDIESGEVGLTYVTPLENSFGAFSRVEHGKLPNGTALGAAAFDNSYRQYGVGATTAYILSGHSRFDGRVEGVSRRYDQGTQRNYSGPIVKALYTWTPTAKITVAAALNRDVGPAEEVQTAFVLITGGYIRPRWNVTDKITVQGNIEYNVWDYRGDPLLATDKRHHVRLYGGSISYRPTPKILLQAGYNREVRTSNIAFADYEVDVVFVEGRIGF